MKAFRWDGDQTGHGIADGEPFTPAVRRLLDAMVMPDWVAEDPDAHLLPHLRSWCEEPDSPWSLLSAELDGAMYVVTLDWLRQGAGIGRLRADVFALIGSVAELSTHVHQRVAGDEAEYDVTTGMLDGESWFRGHGHVLRLRVRGEAVKQAVAGTTHRTL